MTTYDIEGNPIDSSGATYDPSVSAYITGSSAASVNDSGGGTSLNELGTFFAQLGTGVASVIHATNTPNPVTLPRSNLPFASATQGVFGGQTSSILTLLLLGVAVFFGFKALKRA